MSLKQLPKEQVTPVCQTTLALLEREDTNVPGTMIESIVSMKSILRAIIQGQLCLAQEEVDRDPAQAEQKPQVSKPKTKPKPAKKAA